MSLGHMILFIYIYKTCGVVATYISMCLAIRAHQTELKLRWWRRKQGEEDHRRGEQ